jgi:hypothetical protein
MNNLNETLIKEEPEEEIKKFENLIREYRERFVKSPEFYIQNTFSKHASLIDNVAIEKNVSQVIDVLRESAYRDFLVDEANFNYQVISELGKSFQTPNHILNTLISEATPQLTKQETLNQSIKDICGKYASLIAHFYYVLALSNTQARRARAGQTFEQVIYKMYETFGYEFVNQKQVGKKAFEEKGLGKLVDSLLPSLDAFESLKSKTIIGTMKTTLRERWQEVIEELTRTGLPKIYLLTMDNDIAASKSNSMRVHNVIIVVPKEVKENGHLTDKHNIISFEEYFFNEIPPIMEYWKLNPPSKIVNPIDTLRVKRKK